MPMLYAAAPPGALITTNGSVNTANDFWFAKPGSARTMILQSVQGIGRGGNLTSLSGIAIRIEKWTSTSSSGGSAITPTPLDPGFQASKFTAGYSASAVTSGTGGPSFLGGFGFGAAGPNGWVAPNSDNVCVLEAGVNQSIDLFNIAATVSLNLEITDVRVQE